jgi:nickel-dependent lactate racemase
MDLRYGEQTFALTIPEPNRRQVLRVEPPVPTESPETLVKQALAASAPQLASFRPGERVVIVTSDITRYTGSEVYLPLLVQRLNQVGVRDADITIIIALGIHRKQTEAEHKKILGPLYGRIRVVDHECDDPGKLVMIGITSNGTEVAINRTVAEADRVILTGTIGFHYFAGFGGGRKSILPGVASRSSCMASHFAVLNPGAGSGKNSFAVTGNLEQNPVHQAMLEACAMVEPDLLFNTVLAPDKRIIACFAGDWRAAHVAGCRFYAEHFAYPLTELADLVVVSCGGFPKDINVIQSHKAMEYGCQALKPGGVLILLAECRDGYGNATFFDWFKFTELPAFEERLRSHYEINGQTAYSLLAKAQRFRIILVSALPPEEVRTMGMTPAKSLAEAMQLAQAMLPADYAAYVIPDGGTVLPIIKDSRFAIRD